MTLDETIIRQYSSSPRLLTIIQKFNQAIGTERYINDVYDLAWNIETCNSVGLNIWGKIVNVPRYIEVEDEFDHFGFNEASEGVMIAYPETFNQGTFYSGQSTSKMERLTDDAYRKLILCKAFYNISDASIPNINKYLKMIFADAGRAYAIDNLDMTINVIFEFLPAPVEISILRNTNTFPRPAGVKINYAFIESPYFGFAGDAFPFNDGTLYDEANQSNQLIHRLKLASHSLKMVRQTLFQPQHQQAAMQRCMMLDFLR